ncbi:MAG: hypothetical protein R3D51_04055 [Hyphomicrobiaceae bacterium]
MRTATARVWIAKILIIAFACRALIPVGYMPDFDALSKGVVKVVICTSSGDQVIALDANGKPHPAQNGAHVHHPCAFSGLASVDLPDLGLNSPKPAFVEDNLPNASQAAMLPPARAGPGLGSRGPPDFS